MLAIAPNLTVLVGELAGARLIAHAGSLMNLAKHPATTVQILGADKVLLKVIFIPEIFPLRCFLLMNFPSTRLSRLAVLAILVYDSYYHSYSEKFP